MSTPRYGFTHYGIEPRQEVQPSVGVLPDLKLRPHSRETRRNSGAVFTYVAGDCERRQGRDAAQSKQSSHLGSD
jgi:hypothetical protein